MEALKLEIVVTPTNVAIKIYFKQIFFFYIGFYFVIKNLGKEIFDTKTKVVHKNASQGFIKLSYHSSMKNLLFMILAFLQSFDMIRL